MPRGKGRKISKMELAEGSSKGIINPLNISNVVSIFPKQREFLEAKESEVLMCGGRGSAKSYALCLKLIQATSTPKSVSLLCRRYGNTIRKSTLAIILDGTTTLEPLLKEGSYDFNGTTNTIKIHGGGTIYCVGLDEPQKIRSMTVGLVAIDELTQVEDISIWNDLKLCIRMPGSCGQIVAAMNPTSSSSWQYKYFVENKNPIDDKPLKDHNRKCIISTSYDNLALPKFTLDALNALTGAEYDRMVLGKFVDDDSMVYGDTLVNSCLVSELPSKEEMQRWYIGLDYGFVAPTALTLAGIDRDNTMWIYHNEEKSKLLMADMIDMVLQYKDLDPTICVDPSAAQLIGDLQAQGLNVLKAENDRIIGVDRCRSLMVKGKVKINNECMYLLDSLRGLMYGEDGKPKKIKDHSADSYKYLISTCWESIYEDMMQPESNFTFF